MARPKGYDRDAVLTAARDLFWEQGYEAVSVADLEQRTGLNRSGIYQEFGSKHGLFAAALDCYADRVIAGLSPACATIMRAGWMRSPGYSSGWLNCSGAIRAFPPGAA